jgi:hypothetical protein
MVEKLNKDTAYRVAKPKEKDYTVNDGGGLALVFIQTRHLIRPDVRPKKPAHKSPMT